MLKRIEWSPVGISFKDVDYTFINEDVAHDFIVELEDMHNSCRPKDDPISFEEGTHYEKYDIEIFDDVREAIVKFLDI